MSAGNVVGIAGGSGPATVDAAVTDGSTNPVSGDAVFDALAALPPPSVSLTAVQVMGGHRAAVAIGASGCDYADQTNAAHFNRVVGITTAAASAGASAPVQRAGMLEFSGWTWTPNADIFVGSNGLLTQTPPTAGAFIQVVGFALTSTRMWIEIFPPLHF